MVPERGLLLNNSVLRRCSCPILVEMVPVKPSSGSMFQGEEACLVSSSRIISNFVKLYKLSGIVPYMEFPYCIRFRRDERQKEMPGLLTLTVNISRSFHLPMSSGSVERRKFSSSSNFLRFLSLVLN